MQCIFFLALANSGEWSGNSTHPNEIIFTRIMLAHTIIWKIQVPSVEGVNPFLQCVWWGGGVGGVDSFLYEYKVCVTNLNRNTCTKEG